MTKTRKNPALDAYLDATKWRKEIEALRTILLGCRLDEELKWGKPCYTFEGHNVAILFSLKDCCAVMFFKGALLKDAHRILIKPGENSQSARQVRFRNVGEINEKKAALKGYLEEAIEAERCGLEVVLKKTEEFKIPEELRRELDKTVALTKAFKALSPGRQRGYIIYFSGAKQSKTRASRVEKCVPRILAGKGFHDR